MRSVKVTDAKNNLSRHLAYVRAGGRVRIFDRDEPVADLVPVGSAASSGDDDEAARLARLEQAGTIRRGAGGFEEAWLEPIAADPQAHLLDALLDERRNGR